MQNLIFAFMQAYGSSENEALLLAHSIRANAGKLAYNPIWLMIPQYLDNISMATREELSRLDVRLIPFDISEDILNFPYGGKVFGAAAAEKLAVTETDVLLWMDSDTVILQMPGAALLSEGKMLGYRPVMLRNISSTYDKPIDRFWGLIYRGCDTPIDRIFPMLTTVDRTHIRPHFNAGILSLRPSQGLLQAWAQNFSRLYQDPVFEAFYQERTLYRIFIHQAVLAGTLLSLLKPDEMQDLGDRINYPLFLRHKLSADYANIGLDEVVTYRYDDFEFFNRWACQEIITGNKSLSGWLGNHLSRENSPA